MCYWVRGNDLIIRVVANSQTTHTPMIRTMIDTLFFPFLFFMSRRDRNCQKRGAPFCLSSRSDVRISSHNNQEEAMVDYRGVWTPLSTVTHQVCYSKTPWLLLSQPVCYYIKRMKLNCYLRNSCCLDSIACFVGGACNINPSTLPPTSTSSVATIQVQPMLPVTNRPSAAFDFTASLGLVAKIIGT